MSEWKYLRRVNETCLVLDHRLTPEVSAMFSAMASRLPGGIEARYAEVIQSMFHDGQVALAMLFPRGLAKTEIAEITEWCEDRLTQYPLHPRVQEFFDKFVGQYGHASIQELTGQPANYAEGVSPFTAYLSFDNPLVAGQEFSTRAVRKKDWPMCREAYISVRPDVKAELEAEGLQVFDLAPHPELLQFHQAWLEVFEAEVAAWKAERLEKCEVCKGAGRTLTSSMVEQEDRRILGELDPTGDYSEYTAPEHMCEPCEGTGKKWPDYDPQGAFRWALDRARWAIPSTISTGFCHTANTRVMGRVIQAGMDFSVKKCAQCDGIGNVFTKGYQPSYQLTTGKIWVRGAKVTDAEAWEVNLMSRGRLGVTPCDACSCTGKVQSKVWQDIKEAYEEALPGMKGMWMREAVAGQERQIGLPKGSLDALGVPDEFLEGSTKYSTVGAVLAASIPKKGIFQRMEELRKAEAVAGQERQLPGHLKIGFVPPDQEVRLWVNKSSPLSYVQKKAYTRKPNGYLDPAWNQLVQVHITFQCSWAVARDWHRHRTAYPWSMNIVTDPDGIDIHKNYESVAGRESIETSASHTAKIARLLRSSWELFERFREAGDMEKAMLCLPFGTLVSMHTTMGLRDAVYMLELRHYATGTAPEYSAQAGEALRKLAVKLGPELAELLLVKGPDKNGL